MIGTATSSVSRAGTDTLGDRNFIASFVITTGVFDELAAGFSAFLSVMCAISVSSIIGISVITIGADAGDEAEIDVGVGGDMIEIGGS